MVTVRFSRARGCRDLEKPTWRQSLSQKRKELHKKDVLVWMAVATIYVMVVGLMIALPLMLIHSGQNVNSDGDPNIVKNNNNYLPDYCPIYTVVADNHGQPFSVGPLQLPFQRPQHGC